MGGKKSGLKLKGSEDLLKAAFRMVNEPREITFLFGSAISFPDPEDIQPDPTHRLGVPGVHGIIELIRSRLHGLALQDLNRALGRKPSNPYQTAFECLTKYLSHDIANSVIRDAVLQARYPTTAAHYPTASLEEIEHDVRGWCLPTAVRVIATLFQKHAHRFGPVILTTNFDPLIQIAIRAIGGDYCYTALRGDGDISGTVATVPHIVHLHGYWRGGDTLHTPSHLTMPRTRLELSLQRVLAGRTLVVLGYGGWDDVASRTIFRLIREDHDIRVIWCFHEPTLAAARARQPHVLAALEPEINPRVQVFCGITAKDLLILLLNGLNQNRSPEEHEAYLFGLMCDFYIKEVLGFISAEEMRAFDAELVPVARDWRTHVEDELRITSESVRALAEKIEGSPERITEIVRIVLMGRSDVIRSLDEPEAVDFEWRNQIAEMFVHPQRKWGDAPLP
jgi:hypothetical protein